MPAATTWAPVDETASSGSFSIVACLGLALLVLATMCIIAWVIIRLAS